jgi:hypothetical protein
MMWLKAMVSVGPMAHVLVQIELLQQRRKQKRTARGLLETELDLRRFRSGLLGAIRVFKETGYGSDTRRRVQSGCGSHSADEWTDTALAASDLGIGHSTMGKWVRVFSEQAKVAAQDAELLRKNEAAKSSWQCAECDCNRQEKIGASRPAHGLLGPLTRHIAMINRRSRSEAVDVSLQSPWPDCAL